MSGPLTHAQLAGAFGLPATSCPARVVDLGGAWQVWTFAAGAGTFRLIHCRFGHCPACGVAFQTTGPGPMVQFPYRPRAKKGHA